MNVNLIEQESPTTKEYILNADVRRIVETAFNFDGYIAGGFAHQVVKAMNSNAYVDNVCDDYLGHQKISPGNKFNPEAGDIDLFFTTEVQMNQFLNKLTQLQGSVDFYVLNEIQDVYKEIVVSSSKRIQIIKRFYASMEDQVRSFDIYNGMIAINWERMIKPEGVDDLTTNGVLHVANWSSPLVINRISKWFRKHGYSRLSPKTASEIGTAAVEIIEQLKTKPWLPQSLEIANIRNIQPLTHTKVMEKLKQFMPQMTNDQLLLLTAIYPDETFSESSYSGLGRGPFSILRKRAGLT